jgi:hypothetical protein
MKDTKMTDQERQTAAFRAAQIKKVVIPKPCNPTPAKPAAKLRTVQVMPGTGRMTGQRTYRATVIKSNQRKA